MISALVIFALFAALAAAFWLLVRDYAESDLSFWTVLGIVYAAKLITRLANYALPLKDSTERLGVFAIVYVLILTIGLIAAAKVRPVPAILFAIGFAAAATVMSFIAVAYILPPNNGKTP